jgi:protein phosphatase 1 regulatory subunit 7
MSTNDHPADATNTDGSKNDDDAQDTGTGKMKGNNGWDGKLRVDRRPQITNPEALEDPDYTDEDAPPVEEIEADEGTSFTRS